MASVEPNDIGNATEFRTINIADIHKAAGPAPEGYEWATLPGGGDVFGVGPRALLCLRCAALVGMTEAHNAWHEWLTQANR